MRLLLIFIVLLTACRTTPAAPPPPTPLSMDDLHQRRVQSVMGKLATRIVDVTTLLGDRTFSEADQAQVARLLEEVDGLVVALADEPETNRHPAFASFFPALSVHARKARVAAHATTPRYGEVGDLMQVCIACHAATRP